LTVEVAGLVVVVFTSDERTYAALGANLTLAIVEYFRDLGTDAA
jgi:flagellar biosynthesis/type III secretory pathway ATPase